MPDLELPSERHLRFHRRLWLIYLMGCFAMAAGTIADVLTSGDNSELALVATGALFALMFVVAAAQRARHRTEYDRERKRIREDEWTLHGLRRSHAFALRAVIFVQVPLVPLMAYLPSEPSVESSVIGMASMTIALGCGVWAASYLYYTRENPGG